MRAARFVSEGIFKIVRVRGKVAMTRKKNIKPMRFHARSQEGPYV